MRTTYPEAERNPPGNYKSSDAIERWRLADRVAWEAGRAKECSLNPRLGRIHTIGMAAADKHGKVVNQPWTVQAQTESEEKSMLDVFWSTVHPHKGQMVTWNGAWDLRFIVIRSLAVGSVPPIPNAVLRAWFKRYTIEPHFDCKAVLLNWPSGHPQGEGLDEWATFFGIPGKGGLTGADVYPLYQEGKHEVIGTYCEGDVAATAAIYERIYPIFGDTF